MRRLLFFGLIAIVVCAAPFLFLADTKNFIADGNAVHAADIPGGIPGHVPRRMPDLVSIGSVLEAPQQYTLHRVRFEGRISKIETLPGLGGCKRFNAYVFGIEDATGSIEVFDPCRTPESAPLLFVNPVKVGERVSIVVTIEYSTLEPTPSIRARLQWIGRV